MTMEDQWQAARARRLRDVELLMVVFAMVVTAYAAVETELALGGRLPEGFALRSAALAVPPLLAHLA
ncbi:hypothetical protein GT354_14195, partial [Streptomyces sp. SID3343]|nr:hypothetical protein [Streptomyces sp. SID3343]